MPSLPTDLRKQLENTIIAARDKAEEGALSALQKRAVDAAEPFSHFSVEEKQLRNRLRARARQAGDDLKDKIQGIELLTQELAYEYWHRMIFARFLAENHLLMHPDGIAVSLEECDELAKAEGFLNGWALAANYAGRMLPQIFCSDDVLLEVDLAPEHRLALVKLLDGIPVETFQASDSLGWVYQFWQSRRKDQVNKSEMKIGAKEISAVTQLFTEDYMVDFLLDNTLGAWHAGKVLATKLGLAESAASEQEIRQALALQGCPWKYLRFIQDADGKWSPAAGPFEGWQKSAKDLKCLDPCMGSGHFIVAMFERLVSLRMTEEGLDETAAVFAVIADNLFGLEIDQRCTQIAAFNLAFAAWRRVGFRPLPPMHLACSGLAPNASRKDWLALAGDIEKLKGGMERLYDLFEQAPVLGSLINPRAKVGDLFIAEFQELRPLLEKALLQESKDDALHELTVTARGLAKAAEILAGQFSLIATNVPYLGRGKQNKVLQDYCKRVHPEAKRDLANCFIERCRDFCTQAGSCAFVTPHHWVFLGTYKKFRIQLLEGTTWNCIARLGSRAFETISGENVSVALAINSRCLPPLTHCALTIDASEMDSINKKASALLTEHCSMSSQDAWRNGVGCRLLSVPDIEKVIGSDQIGSFADSRNGLSAGDGARFEMNFWETQFLGEVWHALQSSTSVTKEFGGRERIVRWENEAGEMAKLAESVKHLNHAAQNWRRGKPLWGRTGIIVNQIGAHTTIYTGDKYDGSCFAIVPNDENDAVALVAFALQGELKSALTQINPTWNLKSPKTLLELTLDLADWRGRAKSHFPKGLPKPFSSDPTQWLFNGHPAGADQPLHVAVARLLGYQWPRQTGSSFPDCPALGSDGLETLADDDGIVCISAVRGEQPASERLLEFLQTSHGVSWNNAHVDKLLVDAGNKPGTMLEDWLRNAFFEQHSKLFHHRPFIWNIWDGRKDGFSCLLNYHKLDHKSLENLTYSYLGDWITIQKNDAAASRPGADLRLKAAQELQQKLKLIIDGATPYDIFVRWKPLAEQSIGWNPDLNDGVRMNIRPFVLAGVLRKNPNIKWTKDRGKEPNRPADQFPWFWKDGEFTGERVNDVHLTTAEKQSARVLRP